MTLERLSNLAIVSGGSRGLGKALVDVYAARGWQVLEFSRSGTGPHHMTVDLADLDAALGALEQRFDLLAGTEWGHVVFLNNAGLLTPITPVKTLPDAAIEHNLTVNLVSGMRVLAAFVRRFQASGSRITIANISSGAATKGYAGWSLYCAAKAGMENFMRSLAEEQGGSARPMTCISIAPGVVDTDMQAEIRRASAADFPDVARFIELKNAGQLRSPQAAAQAIAAMIDASPTNGSSLRVT